MSKFSLVSYVFLPLSVKGSVCVVVGAADGRAKNTGRLGMLRCSNATELYALDLCCQQKIVFWAASIGADAAAI